MVQCRCSTDYRSGLGLENKAQRDDAVSMILFDEIAL